jgi:hypothetical protein
MSARATDIDEVMFQLISTPYCNPRHHTTITAAVQEAISVSEMTTSSGKPIEATESEVLATSKRNVEALNKLVQQIIDALDLVTKSRAEEFAQDDGVRREKYTIIRPSRSHPTKPTLPYIWTDDAQRALDYLRQLMPLAQLKTKASKQHAEILKWLDWAKQRPSTRPIPHATLVTQIYTELHMTKVWMAALHLVDYRMRNNLAALNFPGLRWCSRLSGSHLLVALKILAMLEAPKEFEYEGARDDALLMNAIVEARDEMPSWKYLWCSHGRAMMASSSGNGGGGGGVVRVKEEPRDE